MNAQMMSPAAFNPTQLEDFEELLRRAAAYSRPDVSGVFLGGGVSKMSFNEIGQTAGAVWETLSNEGPLNFATLMEQVNAPQSLFFMAIGWLARENKLEVEPDGGDYTVRLK
jgi:hypothetical protein